MPGPEEHVDPSRTGRRALARYVVAWFVAGVAAVALVLLLVGGGEDEVSLPPVQQTELTVAAERGGCVLRRGGAPGVPVDGPLSEPARPGVFDDPLPVAAIVGALRRGAVVIHHAPDLPDGQLRRLRVLQSAVPRGTIVAVNPRMEFVVAVTAWRRLLGCRALRRETIDALRLFRGRFIGTGPDSPP